MRVVALIPARFASTRFPGKALAHDTGKPLIQHVYERVAAAQRIDRVLVATDDERIAAAVRAFGGRAEMTRPDHPSGADRVAEVVRRMSPTQSEREAPASAAGDDLAIWRSGDPAISESANDRKSEREAPASAASGDLKTPAKRHRSGEMARTNPDDDIILNVQGDEPEIEPGYLDRLVDRLAASGCPMATLACPFPPDADPRDPARVKVVLNQRGEALYFSRSLIPCVRDPADEASARGGPLLHLGVYAFRRAFLLEFTGWQPAALERAEKLEQLRALEYGCAVAVEVVERAFAGVDTPADYDAFVRRWRAAQ